MINAVWMFLVGFGIITAAFNGKTMLISDIIFTSAAKAVEFSFGLAGMIAFWTGILKIAEASRITEMIARLFQPLFRQLFPMLRLQKKALGLISMTMAANLLGLGNVATPLGLKAMAELTELNPEPKRASNDICTFMTIIFGGLSVIPTTLIAIRSQAGSTNPALVLIPVFVITLAATLAGLTFNFLALHWSAWLTRKKRLNND